MNRFLTAFVVFMVTLILPIQGLAAVVLPATCYTSSATLTHKVAESDKVMKEAVSLEANGRSGNNCESPCDQHGSDSQMRDCHACHIPTMQEPTASVPVLVPDTVQHYPPVISSPYTTFVSSLFRPPKILLA